MLYLSGKEDHTARADEIAQDMQISKSFLQKILKQLEKADLVQLKRGVSGGVKLLKNPIEITLYDVIVAVEKILALNKCLTNEKICGLMPKCPVHPVWFKIRQGLIQELKEINFKELSAKGTAL